MLVYDVTDRESFQAVDTWMAEIAKVTEAEGNALAAKHGIPFFEVSAKANTNVAAAFERITADVKQRLDASGAGTRGGGRPGRAAGGGSVDVGAGRGGGAGASGGKKGCC
ncbi:RABE1D [Symbiodinium sp. KB8]|nr:RABE1D [Symbiodinium sp. KB8]